MEAPAGRMSPERFNAAIEAHARANYDETASGYTCKKCKAEIQQVTCTVSLHESDFPGCTGWGEVKKVPLPFCPNCEGVPNNTRSCIHV